MTSVLMGQAQQDELSELINDSAIQSIAKDLKAIGETPKSIRSHSRYDLLNNRYQSLTGKTCLRIGSVMDAVLFVMEDSGDVQ